MFLNSAVDIKFRQILFYSFKSIYWTLPDKFLKCLQLFPKSFCIYLVGYVWTKKKVFLDYPSYSPDLAPCNYFLFPRVKHLMRGEHFSDIEGIKRETTKTLETAKLSEYEHCFSKWQQRWQRYTHAERDYFEEDNVNYNVEWNLYFLGILFTNYLSIPRIKKFSILCWPSF